MVNRRSALKLLVGAFVAVGAGISALFLTRRSLQNIEEVSEAPQQPPEGIEIIPEPVGVARTYDPAYLGLAAVFNGNPKQDVSTRMIVDSMVQGMIASPTAPGKYPGIIMIHEWWGLTDQVKSMAHILAGEGYVVFAVDLFDGNVATEFQGARSNIQNHPNEETVSKLRATVGYLRMAENVDAGRIGTLGWCYGGGQSYQVSLVEDIKATVIYYGRVSTDKEVLSALQGPVLGIFGSEDQSIPLENIVRFQRSLQELGKEPEIHIYENAGHAFANPTNSSIFRKGKAIDAWKKTLDFFERNL